MSGRRARRNVFRPGLSRQWLVGEQLAKKHRDNLSKLLNHDVMPHLAQAMEWYRNHRDVLDRALELSDEWMDKQAQMGFSEVHEIAEEIAPVVIEAVNSMAEELSNIEAGDLADLAYYVEEAAQ